MTDESIATRLAVLEQQVKDYIEYVDAIRDERDKALDLQAKEYERRLDALNHSHTQAQAKNSEYLPREIYEKSEYERRKWQAGVDTTLAVATSKTATYAAIFAAVVAVVGLLMGIYAAFGGEG